jgi:MOSC domain-containing protein YiiM
VSGLVVSVQVARAGLLAYRGDTVKTAIRKRPVDGPAQLHPTGFDGDEQADHDHHGGLDMAASFFASEHQRELAERLDLDLQPGAFGENLTTEGLIETEVMIGDVLRIGEATVVQVAQPRGPCFKIAARHGVRKLPGIIALELKAGFLARVVQPGPVQAGDAIELIERHSEISVAETLRVIYRDRGDDDAIAAVLAVPELAAQTADGIRRNQDRRALTADDFA